MRYQQDGTKLRLVPETEQETRWVSTLAESSKRIKPGSQYFVEKAFHEWVQAGAVVPTPEERLQAIAKDADDSAFKVWEANGGALRTQAIMIASALAQKGWGQDLGKLIQYNGEPPCVHATLDYRGFSLTGIGSCQREAREEISIELCKRAGLWSRGVAV